MTTPVSDRPKMGTDIPEAITIPDTLETRLGTLRFFDGFPDDATVEKVFDNLDFQRGVQAVLTAMPAASIETQRRTFLEFGPANQTVLLFESLMDSRTLFLTPNTESVYVLGWLDLSTGPVVIEAPPGLLGLVDDHWFHYVTDIGLAGPDQGQGGKFLFVPPDHDSELPDGYFVCRSNTFGNLFALRGFLVDGSPRPAVDAVKQQLRIYPLAEADDPPETTFVDASGESFNTIHALNFSFFEEVNEVVQTEPNSAIDPETLGLLASIGIEKGKPFAPDERMKAILTEAAAVGHATARALAYRTRLKEAFFYPDSAWCTPFVGGSYLFEQDGVRLLDARSFFFYATGITPAMTIQRVGAGSAYAAAFVDSNNQPSDGGKHYRLRLPSNVPAKTFWSLVLYDNQTRSMLQTDDPHPSISSLKAGIETNPDGSLDVHFGPQPPPDKAHNWVQTWPGKGWNILFRLYGPLEPWFDKSWRLPDIKPIKE